MSERHSLTFSGRRRSISCAVNGVRVMLQSQQNAWIHAIATVLVCMLGLTLRVSTSDWCWIVLAVVAVWTAEALNTAFEFLTDVASPGFHPVAGRAKDVAAGAVLISAVGSIVIGLLVFGPYVRRWVTG
jgi:diacylglycerol kinase (ATP)